MHPSWDATRGFLFFFFCFRFFLPSIVFTAVAFRWPCFVAFDCHSIFIYQRTRVLCELNVFQVSYVNPLSPCIITNPPLCSCFFLCMVSIDHERGELEWIYRATNVRFLLLSLVSLPKLFDALCRHSMACIMRRTITKGDSLPDYLATKKK